jgi:hypothetical protein
VVVVATLLDMLPPPSIDGVNKLYHHLGEILTIAAAQQAECIRWCSAIKESTSSPARSRADSQKATVEPNAAGMTPSLAWVSSKGPPR